MLEYVFFHRTPYQAFLDFLSARQVDASGQAEDGCFEVQIPEDLDDELAEAIEDEYDRLMEMNQQLVDAEQQEGEYHAAGVVVNLGDGRTVYADVDPRLLARIMEVLSPEELGEVVNAVVDAVENPDERSYCQRMRDGE